MDPFQFFVLVFGGSLIAAVLFTVLMLACTMAPFLLILGLLGWAIYRSAKQPNLARPFASNNASGAGRLLGAGVGVAGALVCVAGAMLLVPAGGLYYLDANLQSNWVLTTGRVTAMFTQESVDTDTGARHTVYCPTVEFETTDAQTVVVDVNDCSTPAAFAVDDPVELFYNPQNPQSVLLKNSSLRVLGTIFAAVLGGLGLICVVPGIVMMLIGIVLAMRRRRMNGPFG